MDLAVAQLGNVQVHAQDRCQYGSYPFKIPSVFSSCSSVTFEVNSDSKLNPSVLKNTKVWLYLELYMHILMYEAESSPNI